MAKYFGTDGFRGKVGETLRATHAFLVGRFLGDYFAKQEERVRILVGKDTRLSCGMLESALASGICASGGDVYLLGVTTTPAVAFLVKQKQFDCAVMISASHNPFEDNGLKLLNKNGEKMEDDVICQLETFLDDENMQSETQEAVAEAVGEVFDSSYDTEEYIEHLYSCCKGLSLVGKRIGLDCANGGAWKLAPSVFGALGADVTIIGNTPDGTNINQNVGSTHIQALVELVKEHNLDVGFAFDGDADRLIAVDNTGTVIDGDKILYLCATWLKEKGMLKTNTVVATVMSNLGLKLALEKQKIVLVTTDVGDRFVYQKMKEDGHLLGGEQSGHIIFGQLATTGDGILTALMVLSAAFQKPLAELSQEICPLPQLIKNVRVKDKDKQMQSKALQWAVEAASAMLGKSGRVLVRASGTESVLRIMVEAKSKELCQTIAKQIEKVIEQE